MSSHLSSHLSLSESLECVLTQGDVESLVQSRSYKTHNVFDELTFYAELDPILGGLLRQFKEAETHIPSVSSPRDNLHDNPMREIIQDRCDSLWCAVQTRLLELQSDETVSGMVDMRLMRLAEERAGRLIKQDQEKAHQQKNNKDTDFLMFFLWMWLMNKWSENSLLNTQKALGYRFSEVA